MNDTEKDSHESPGNHDARNPYRGSEPLHGQVGRDLGGDIEGEEHGHSNLHSGQRKALQQWGATRRVATAYIVVPFSSHVQIFFESR